MQTLSSILTLSNSVEFVLVEAACEACSTLLSGFDASFAMKLSKSLSRLSISIALLKNL